MQVSARNQFVGTVQEIKQDSVMAEVTVRLADGVDVVSVITAASAQRLNIQVGGSIVVVIKSTDVLLASEE